MVQNSSQKMIKDLCQWASGNLGTGVKMRQWNFHPNDNCPFCLQPKEDTKHILLYQHQDAIKIWEEQMDRIFSSLTKWDTKQLFKVPSHRQN